MKHSGIMRYFLKRLRTFEGMLLGVNPERPERNILTGYFVYMLVGFALLMLPFATRRGDVYWLDNLFTAVSAVSTTGLATVDLTDTYTLFGQIVILLLVQLGGIGYMTMTSYIRYLTTHHSGSGRPVLEVSIARPQGMHLQDLVYNIIHFTFIFELLGFMAFYVSLAGAGDTSPAWHALYLSVSSFCTAGFSPFSDSLCAYATNIGINLTVALLSYAGALGFIVITDLTFKLTRPGYRITFTTKVILLITAIMTVGGTFILAFSPTMEHAHTVAQSITLSFFQTMSAMTTVGFNTVDLSGLHVGPILVFSLIMFVGASPSGTGGGVKTTAVSAVWGFVISKLGIRREVTFLGRIIPSYRTDSALTAVISYGTLIFIGCIVLSYSEPFGLSRILFEATSAIGTVGLSTGITPHLSDIGKWVIIVLMYVGRIGIITFGTALLSGMNSSTPSRMDDLVS